MRSRRLQHSGPLAFMAMLAFAPEWAFAQSDGEASEPAAPQPVVFGTWVTEPKTEVTIGPCQEGYCGTISKIVVPENIRAEYGDQIDQIPPDAFTDMNNEDPALRDRPIQGLRILTLTERTAPERFDGEIYNPEDGKTYEGFVEVLGPDRLRLSGCVMFNTICQGQDWVRAPEPPADPVDPADVEEGAPVPAERTASN